MSRTAHLRERVKSEAKRALSMQEQARSLSQEMGFQVRIRPSAKAERLIMRPEAAAALIRVSAPPSYTPEEIADFVRSNAGWARARLARLPDRVPFLPGRRIPILGTEHLIRQDVSARFLAKLEQGDAGPIILVGRTDHVEAHVVELLKSHARETFTRWARAKAARIDRRVARVIIRDQSTRWGSCTASGVVNLTWRLIVAPEDIADYVVSHEVAHLSEMNHSGRFWRLCNSLSSIPASKAAAWLKQNGSQLHRYGPDAPGGHPSVTECDMPVDA